MSTLVKWFQIVNKINKKFVDGFSARNITATFNYILRSKYWKYIVMYGKAPQFILLTQKMPWVLTKEIRGEQKTLMFVPVQKRDRDLIMVYKVIGIPEKVRRWQRTHAKVIPLRISTMKFYLEDKDILWE